MALVIEDGSGVSGANSYATEAEANAYLDETNRNASGSAWKIAGSKAREGSLALAQKFLQARWNGKWKGRETNEFQALDWPRIHVQRKNGYFFNQTDIPLEVKQAQIEYALIEITTPGTLFPVIQYDDTNRPLKKIREKVDVLEEEREFSDSPVVSTWRKFPIADGLIRHLVTTGGTLLRM